MKIVLICFSNNLDLQELFYSLSCEPSEHSVYTIGIANPKYSFAHTPKNFFYPCPKRPGITPKTFDVFLLSRIVRKIGKIKPDIVYFESLHVWNLFILDSPRLHCRFVSSIHDVKPHSDGLKGRLIREITNIVVKKSDAVFLRSVFEYRSFCQLLPSFSHKAFYFPLSKVFKSFSPYSNGDYALFFGRMTRYKGLDDFFVIAQKCSRIHFVIAGKFDDISLADKLRSLENVKVINRYISDEELHQFLIGSFCAIAPYKTATQSGVAVQAFQCSRPVVAFDVGGLHEQIVDGINGFLIRSGDVDEFARKIQEIAALSPLEKNQMCKKSFDIGESKYSSSGNAPLFYDLLEKIHEN
jgi:glycosyltransferase involved in cell wall biosynthesis